MSTTNLDELFNPTDEDPT
ncbi:unnamed protein product, partial [Adineta ricciae]